MTDVFLTFYRSSLNSCTCVSSTEASQPVQNLPGFLQCLQPCSFQNVNMKTKVRGERESNDVIAAPMFHGFCFAFVNQSEHFWLVLITIITIKILIMTMIWRESAYGQVLLSHQIRWFQVCCDYFTGSKIKWNVSDRNTFIHESDVVLSSKRWKLTSLQCSERTFSTCKTHQSAPCLAHQFAGTFAQEGKWKTDFFPNISVSCL